MAELKEQLRTDLTAAMKAQDDLTKSTLRMALAAIKTEELAGATARELTNDEELAVLTKEVRKREESATTYAEANRPELAEKEAAEAALLARYLPAALTEEELAALVATEIQAVADELGEPPTMKQMGAIVRAVNAKATGRAEGKTIAGMVKRALN